ncbi:hypothetical protein NKCBBBOE_01669 [Pseudarthrobacter sp. MM222]|nr:hypothetical protein NKCBBBOE_01669 [Pseudarthrobacter sp. MM222]
MDPSLRNRARDTAIAFLIIFGFVAAMVYGYMANLLIRNAVLPMEQQQLVSVVSLFALAVAGVGVACAIAISSPEERLFPNRHRKRDTRDSSNEKDVGHG